MRRGAMSEDKMVSGDLVIDFAGCAVFIEGKRVPMTPKECELLFLLAPCGKHDYRRLFGFAYFLGCRKAVELRHHSVHDNHIEICFARFAYGFHAVCGELRFIALEPASA